MEQSPHYQANLAVSRIKDCMSSFGIAALAEPWEEAGIGSDDCVGWVIRRPRRHDLVLFWGATITRETSSRMPCVEVREDDVVVVGIELMLEEGQGAFWQIYLSDELAYQRFVEAFGKLNIPPGEVVQTEDDELPADWIKTAVDAFMDA